MTKEEWLERELAKAPEPTAADVWWVLNRFGFPQEQVEAAYEAMQREKKEREEAEQRGGGQAGDVLSEASHGTATHVPGVADTGPRC